MVHGPRRCPKITFTQPIVVHVCVIQPMPSAQIRRMRGEGDTEIILEFCFAKLNDGTSQSVVVLCEAHSPEQSPCLREISAFRVTVGRHDTVG